MTYTLGEAAEVTGRSRGAILRALQTGEIAATHEEATDEWTIEPDDLFRIFPVAYHIRFVLEAVEPLRSEIRELRSRLEAAEAAISAAAKRLDAKSEEQPPAPPAAASPNSLPGRWWRRLFGSVLRSDRHRATSSTPGVGHATRSGKMLRAQRPASDVQNAGGDRSSARGPGYLPSGPAQGGGSRAQDHELRQEAQAPPP